MPLNNTAGCGALHDVLCNHDGRSLIFIGVGGVSVAYSMPLALRRLLPRIWPLQAAGDQGMYSAASQTVLEQHQSFLEPLQRNAYLSKNISSSAAVMTGTRFGETLDEYCIHECGVVQEGVVGCDCYQSPPRTELPSLVFQSPASGLITVGVL